MSNATQITSYDQAIEVLDACRDADDLSDFARSLYDSGLLDESEQIFHLGGRGPLAPWEAPQGSEEIWSNGEDCIMRLPGGALAQWDNSEREWSDVDRDDGRLPVRCECGEVTGTPCSWVGPRAQTVRIEWMPLHLRASHEAAGNRGVYPHNGAIRLRCHEECADSIVESDEEWTDYV